MRSFGEQGWVGVRSQSKHATKLQVRAHLTYRIGVHAVVRASGAF
jgi:hypothetical protein